MIFSKLGRSFSRASRAKNVINGCYKGRPALLDESVLIASSNFNPSLNRFDPNLGFLRSYLCSIGAQNKDYLSDLRYVLANPSFCRFFSSETPKKKNYENFYPKEKKEVPKTDEQKSESKVNHDNDESQNTNSVESVEDFETRIFGSLSNENSSSLFRKLDNIKKAQFGQGINSNVAGQGQFGFGDSSSTVVDGFDSKLKQAANYFEFDPDEVTQDDYTFRPDMNFRTGMTYTTEDLNLKKPGVWKPSKRSEFQVTSEEVLRKADFRNVRFLANFLTDAGIIIKRSKTGISAKAQRKVAREIKIARAFGLLPFTTMGTKQFVFGRTMEDLDEDYQLDVYGAPADDIQDRLAE